MPAKSKQQQKFFGWLYSKKKSGDTSGMSEDDIKTMEGMSTEQIRDFAATKRKGLPKVVKPKKMNKSASAIVDKWLMSDRDITQMTPQEEIAMDSLFKTSSCAKKKKRMPAILKKKRS